jgi:uncharacterized protein YdaU (DUF1376 family)
MARRFASRNIRTDPRPSADVSVWGNSDTMKTPAFQFYPKDWDADENVIPMTYEEEGVYWALCRRYWLAGSLPSDLNRLRVFLKGHPSLEKMREWWQVVGPCFRVRGAKLAHKRLDAERKKQAKNRKVRKLAAEKRWEREHANGNANASRVQSLSSSSSTTSSTAVKKESRRDKPAPDPRVRTLAGFFNELHVAKFGTKAAWDGGKDGALLKALLGQRDELELRGLMQLFFASTDPFIKNAGYTFGVFKSQIGKLLAKMPDQAHQRPVPLEETDVHQQFYKNSAEYRAQYDAMKAKSA